MQLTQHRFSDTGCSSLYLVWASDENGDIVHHETHSTMESADRVYRELVEQAYEHDTIFSHVTMVDVVPTSIPVTPRSEGIAQKPPRPEVNRSFSWLIDRTTPSLFV